jgi:hypothetical protein
MPLYFFHTQASGSFPDSEGTELPNIDGAGLKAAKMLGDLLRKQPQALWPDGEIQLTVTDHTGLTLFNLDVSVTHAPATIPSRKTSTEGQSKK